MVAAARLEREVQSLSTANVSLQAQVLRLQHDLQRSAAIIKKGALTEQVPLQMALVRLALHQ